MVSELDHRVCFVVTQLKNGFLAIKILFAFVIDFFSSNDYRDSYWLFGLLFLFVNL